jgi:hypothetical protein
MYNFSFQEYTAADVAGFPTSQHTLQLQILGLIS